MKTGTEAIFKVRETNINLVAKDQKDSPRFFGKIGRRGK